VDVARSSAKVGHSDVVTGLWLLMAVVSIIGCLFVPVGIADDCDRAF
jgi:hypothetical protein